uniref:Cytochrome c oxidase assembly protein COX16 homolog, mitochondrial n=1 Tax=Gallus gallus TaxID=9031 RepID=A0A8V0ZID0_CHICK
MERFRKLWRGRTMTFGVPLLLYIVGGSFGLREFAQIRYDVHKLHGKVDPALKEKLKQNNVTLESEYEVLGLFGSTQWKLHLVYGVVKLAASHLSLPPFWAGYFCAVFAWFAGGCWPDGRLNQFSTKQLVFRIF